jgi:LacI family transcriptional regulator
LDVLVSKRGFLEESLSRLWENYAGILIGAYQLDELLIREFMTSSRPCLWVKNYPVLHADHAVRIDFERAGFLAAEHLIRDQRRDLGLIYFGEDITISHDFAEGVKNAALEYGARIRSRNIAAISHGQAGQVSAAISEFDHPNGILCFTDEFAAAACAALKSEGLLVPEDVAVIGCNNTLAGELCSPPVTTIDIPTFELGKLAATALIKVIHGEKFVPVLLEPKLIVRESSIAAYNTRKECYERSAR